MRLAFLALALLLAGCATPADDTAPTPTPTATPTTESSFTVEAVPLAVSLVERPGVGVPPTTMGIDPAHLEVKEDQRVNLTVTNDGNGPHNLVIDGLDVATDTLAPGESVSIEFVAQEKGTYKMYCSVGGAGPTGHDAQGMHGSLMVA